jgi:hypothetical protein
MKCFADLAAAIGVARHEPVVRLADLLPLPVVRTLEIHCQAQRPDRQQHRNGLPNCSQCVRVEWQPQRKRFAAAAWPQNMGNSLHFAVRKNAA